MSPKDGGLVIFRMSNHLKRSESKFSIVETMTNESFSRTGQVLDIQGRWNRMFSEGPKISDWETALCEFLFAWDTFVKSRGPKTWFGPNFWFQISFSLLQWLSPGDEWNQVGSFLVYVDWVITDLASVLDYKDKTHPDLLPTAAPYTKGKGKYRTTWSLGSQFSCSWAKVNVLPRVSLSSSSSSFFSSNFLFRF